MKRLTRTIALCTAMSLLGTGCFGSFALVTKLYNFNKEVGDKWAQSLVFWALAIIPVYELAALGDAVVLNVIEFWTGSNPVKTSQLQDGTQVETELVAADTVRVRRIAEGRVISDVQFVRVGDNAGMIRNSDGDVLSTIEALPDGSFALGGPRGARLVTADQVASLTQSAYRGTLMADAARLLEDGALAAR